jgi:hypothetical protein
VKPLRENECVSPPIGPVVIKPLCEIDRVAHAYRAVISRFGGLLSGSMLIQQ